MKQIINRYRHRGAHRAHRPGPMPRRPAVDPWAAHGLFGPDWMLVDVARR
jgi:hypothetical protein